MEAHSIYSLQIFVNACITEGLGGLQQAGSTGTTFLRFVCIYMPRYRLLYVDLIRRLAWRLMCLHSAWFLGVLLCSLRFCVMLRKMRRRWFFGVGTRFSPHNPVLAVHLASLEGVWTMDSVSVCF